MTEREYFDAVEKIINKALAAGMTLDEICKKLEIDTDGTFYFSLGRQMYNQGFRSFDNVTIYTFLENKPTVKKHFDELGGYATVSETWLSSGYV